jgi:hypothetical protein
MALSTGIRGSNSDSAAGVRHFFKATSTLGIHLSAAYRTFWPDKFEAWCQAFEAGVWEEADRGISAGHSIIFKLGSDMHEDGNDAPDFPTATIPAGLFRGGEMYFPDLRLKFRYFFCHLSVPDLIL